jgi:hypothetical protein
MADTPTALEQMFMLRIRLNAPVGTLITDPTPYDQPRRPVVNLLGGTYADDPVNNQGVITLGGGGGVLRGTFGTRPAAGTSGRLYLCTDGPLSFFDDGVVWRPYHGSMPLSQIPPVASVTAIQAGGRATTMVDLGGAIFMDGTNAGNAEDYRILKLAAPATPYVHTVHFIPTMSSLNYCGSGICFRNSTNGNCVFFGPIYNSAISGGVTMIIRNDGASNNGASPTFGITSDLFVFPERLMLMFGNGLWLRQADDGTNLTWSWSLDGFRFAQLFSTTRVSVSIPNEIGIWVAPSVNGNPSLQSQALFTSWLAA